MEQFLTTETLIIELLLIVALVAIGVRRLRIPYTVALVVVGLLLTFRQELHIDLSPEIILTLFVPPLIFEAAFHLEFKRLRENLVPILVLAIFGVVLTTIIVGLIVSAGVGLPLTTALVFGALISATDPVAVIALFRALGAPKRLAVIVESESLFNDGTAIVLFNLMLAAALPSSTSTQAGGLDLLGAVVDFVRVGGLGVGIGVALGWCVAQLIARVDDYLIETTLTTVLAFGAYLLAERFHVSGVLAVVGAGMICGNYGPRGMSPTTRIVLFNFWEYLAFIANSLVFLLIGLDVNLPQIWAYLGPISIGVLAVLVSRMLVVYGFTWLTNRREPRISRAYQHVLVWGGLRGAISLALVLSLPTTFPDRELLRIMAFGVVLFTLLAQGTTMNLLLRRLGLLQRAPQALEYERRHAHLMAARAARARVEVLYQEGAISPTTWELLKPELDQHLQAQVEAHGALLRAQPALHTEEQTAARREGLRAQRTTVTNLFNTGVVSEEIYQELVGAIDAKLTHGPEAYAVQLPPPHGTSD
jgi:monovalent cation:H+ antiporter, CPA1 family